MSLVVPLRRYRCRSMRCNWEGNLRLQRHSPSSPDSAESYERCERKFYVLEPSRMGRVTPSEKQSR